MQKAAEKKAAPATPEKSKSKTDEAPKKPKAKAEETPKKAAAKAEDTPKKSAATPKKTSAATVDWKPLAADTGAPIPVSVKTEGVNGLAVARKTGGYAQLLQLQAADKFTVLKTVIFTSAFPLVINY